MNVWAKMLVLILALSAIAAGSGAGTVDPEGVAEAHGHGHFNWFELISSFINFAIFAGGLGYILRKPLTEGLALRRENMARQLQEAIQKQEHAEKRLAEYSFKLDHLEEEVQRIVASFQAQGRADRERLAEDAEKAAQRMVREVDFTIRQETLKSQDQIRQAAITATLELAERLVKQRITDLDQHRLQSEYIAQIEQAKSLS